MYNNIDSGSARGSTNELGRQVLTPEQYYQATGRVIGKNRVYELLRAKRIKHLHIGRRYYIPASEVDDFFTRELRVGSHEWSLS